MVWQGIVTCSITNSIVFIANSKWNGRYEKTEK